MYFCCILLIYTNILTMCHFYWFTLCDHSVITLFVSKIRRWLSVGFLTQILLWDRETTHQKRGRNIRFSPLYTRLESICEFGQIMGYERPLYFRSSSGDDDDSGLWYDRASHAQDLNAVRCMWVGPVLMHSNNSSSSSIKG